MTESSVKIRENEKDGIVEAEADDGLEEAKISGRIGEETIGVLDEVADYMDMEIGVPLENEEPVFKTAWEMMKSRGYF